MKRAFALVAACGGSHAAARDAVQPDAQVCTTHITYGDAWIVWTNGWPAVPGAPSSATRPLP